MTTTVEYPSAGEAAIAAMIISGESDLLRIRSALRACAHQAGLGLTATTKVVTAGSELTRNILSYATGGQGTASIQQATAGHKRGVRAEFTDQGPGIADLELALRSGYSTAGSLGVGLPGSRRLVDEFAIQSAPTGTRIVICQWER